MEPRLDRTPPLKEADAGDLGSDTKIMESTIDLKCLNLNLSSSQRRRFTFTLHAQLPVSEVQILLQSPALALTRSEPTANGIT